MEKEIFKDIPGYEGLYKITKIGDIWSESKKSKKNKYLSNGRWHQTLYKDGIKRNYRVSQLIAMAFLGHEVCKYDIVVDHINNDPTDDRLENLQLVTNRYNTSKDRKSKSSIYTGVCYCRQTGRWKSSIMIDSVNIFLGRYDTQEQAYEAYMNKLKEIEHIKKTH